MITVADDFNARQKKWFISDTQVFNGQKNYF